MKTKLPIYFLFVTLCISLHSCKKSGLEIKNEKDQFAAMQKLQAYQQAIAASLIQDFGNRGEANLKPNNSRFIMPFFTVDAWGVMQIDPVTHQSQSVIFSVTLLDKNDFYRLNNDSTVSVHITSNKALALYYEDANSPTGLTYNSTNAQYVANYTGPVVEYTFPDFTIKFIDLDGDLRQAVSLHGNANVFQNGQVGSLHIAAKVIQTPSGQTQRSFQVH